MLTILLLIIIVALLAGGYYGQRAYGARALIGVVILALLILMTFWVVSDQIAVGPGVPPIITQ